MRIEFVRVKPQVQQAPGWPPGTPYSGSGADKVPQSRLGCSRHIGLPVVGNPQEPEAPSGLFPPVRHDFSCAPCPGLAHMCGGKWQHLFPRVPEPAARPAQLFSLCSIGMPLAAFQVFEQLPSGSRHRTFYSWHPFLSHRCVGTAP